MAKQSGNSGVKPGIRRGTAKRRAGRETAARLVEAAHDQLASESYERFSMRNVAERAGVSLANLQYYFPRRQDLAQALGQELDTRYRMAYQEVLSRAPDDPVARFEAVLHYQMMDITRKPTRQFFIQFWALLGAMDEFSGHYLGELYALDVGYLSEMIQAIQPDINPLQVEQRAMLIAAMIEGLMVVKGDMTKMREKQLLQSAFDTAMDIATGPAE